MTKSQPARSAPEEARTEHNPEVVEAITVRDEMWLETLRVALPSPGMIERIHLLVKSYERTRP